MNVWPPDYTVIRHPRSKRVKIKASAKKGLELIVPPRFSLKHIPIILVENRPWIEKQLLKLANPERATLPEKIVLRAIDETWSIEYIESDFSARIIARPHQALAVVGAIRNQSICKNLLINWLKQLARHHLKNQLDTVSREIDLTYRKMTIRDQETRWGSCTKDKNISLNYRLLFLPAPLMKHILIHELCHTVHLNHSSRFWKLVEKHDPNWETHRRDTKKVREFVPAWTDHFF
ncbi:MAG TPA: SprT family zinc-dependent metalloprotease [Gammaproteobacteria bacterium]|nr:SprT family zinc-dependent metalloprotease [Gammaproteobacteria bacterium]